MYKLLRIINAVFNEFNRLVSMKYKNIIINIGIDFSIGAKSVSYYTKNIVN